jgi:hypothetical protein
MGPALGVSRGAASLGVGPSERGQASDVERPKAPESLAQGRSRKVWGRPGATYLASVEVGQRLKSRDLASVVSATVARATIRFSLKRFRAF